MGFGGKVYHFDSAIDAHKSIIIQMAVSQFFDNAGGASEQPFQEAQEQQQQQQSSEPFAPRSNVSSGSATPTKRKAAAAGS